MRFGLQTPQFGWDAAALLDLLKMTNLLPSLTKLRQGRRRRHFIKPSNALGLMRFSKPSGITGDWHEPC